MIKKIATLLFSVGLLLGFQSCNPECDTLQTSNVFVPPGPYEEGTELAITAQPANAIEGRKIFVSSKTQTGSSFTTELKSRFIEELGAAVVEIPTETDIDVQFFIEDPDCGNLIPIGETSKVVDPSFFVDNPFFITPTPPLIIIPSPPVAPPPAVVNAWFSPNNREYCIWFVPAADTINGKRVEYSTLVPAAFPIKGSGEARGSVELAAGCNPSSQFKLYHNNPVSGIIDREKNIIKITIDRTNKNLGKEDLVGQFINPENLPEGMDYNIGGICNPDGKGRPNIMFLTSLQTGRQVILYRQAD
ncbi:MAG: hypothetical protein IPJ74_08355 [Saprospiraceae bacterium]|nr:hypothetical protein [Saprospiraceae bacterium]